MLKAQAIASLTSMLHSVTDGDEARAAVRQAIASSGLRSANTISRDDMQRLLEALATEGGVIEAIAAGIARNGLSARPSLRTPFNSDPTDRSAA